MEMLNCWEFNKCERTPHGLHAEEFGVCPAATEKKLNGVHGGVNAGRACWVVAGTLCGGQVQGTFAKKYATCEQCDFHQLVREQEGPHYRLGMALLNKLKED